MQTSRQAARVSSPHGVLMRRYCILRYFGFVVMRVRSDNPGIWLVHCHMDYHLASGMGFALDIRQVCDVVRSPDTRHFSTHRHTMCTVARALCSITSK